MLARCSNVTLQGYSPLAFNRYAHDTVWRNSISGPFHVFHLFISYIFIYIISDPIPCSAESKRSGIFTGVLFCLPTGVGGALHCTALSSWSACYGLKFSNGATLQRVRTDVHIEGRRTTCPLAHRHTPTATCSPLQCISASLAAAHTYPPPPMPPPALSRCVLSAIASHFQRATLPDTCTGPAPHHCAILRRLE